MKAVVIQKYGPPEKVLTIKEIEKPSPKANQLLIKVVATTVNDYDWSMARGKPYLYRLIFGLRKPRDRVSGMELSGVVEAVGSNVQNFKAGDAVYGDISQYGFGSFAEYICIDEKAVVRKPDGLSFGLAVAIPHAGLLAFQGLSDIGKIKEGQRVLINGAGGGVGSVAGQFARLYNCEVTGVDTAEKFDMMKSSGYDHVIDYRELDFTKTGEKYDLILDCKTNRPPYSYMRALKPRGKYVTVGGSPGQLINMLFLGFILSLFSTKKLRILPLKPNKGLEEISELFRQDKIKCVIDAPYAMQDIPRLVQYFGEGNHKGKIVVNIN